MPFAIILSEVLLIEMAKNTCHGNIARAPWQAKIEIEFVILHIRVASNIMLQTLSQVFSRTGAMTYSIDSSSTEVLGHRLGNRRLFSYTKDLACHASNLTNSHRFGAPNPLFP